MCEVLDLPLLGRIPFDRTLAKTFDKGSRSLIPTIRRSGNIKRLSGGFNRCWIIKKSWRKSCKQTGLEGEPMKFVCLNCETYMTFQRSKTR